MQTTKDYASNFASQTKLIYRKIWLPRTNRHVYGLYELDDEKYRSGSFLIALETELTEEEHNYYYENFRFRFSRPSNPSYSTYFSLPGINLGI